ncbi:alcohol dehydrogenase, partial [Streptomyces coeruleorubidus]
AQDAHARPPEPLDSAILFGPVGELVPVALRVLDRGGVLAIADIHLTYTPPPHCETELFHEKQVRSVASSTRDHPHVSAVAGRGGATDLKAGRFDGAAVLVNDLS